MAAIQKSTNSKCWWGCGEKGTLLHCWCKCKLIQSLWRTMWRFLKNTGTRTAIQPSNPTDRHTHRGNQIERDTCTPMFIAALFTIAKTWKQPRCSLADEWIRKLWYINTMEYSIQSLSSVRLFVTPWTTAHQASLSITNSQSLPNSWPLSRWCHSIISSNAIQSFPASGIFPRSQFFTTGGQGVGVSASASVFPMNIKEWFPLGMEHYSAIKRNTFESVLVGCMKPEPITQNEISQKVKHLYHVSLHIYGIWKDGKDNPICQAAKETQM